MTFTPQVLTQTDNNNSVASLTDTSFNGISTITTGFSTGLATLFLLRFNKSVSALGSNASVTWTVR